MEEVIKKFGKLYRTTPETLKMGIHYALGKEAAKRFAGKQKIADVCTGAGFMAVCLAEVVKEITVVDIDQSHLQLAKENSKIAGYDNKFRFIEGDIMDDKILNQLVGVEAIYSDPEWVLPGHWKGDHVSSIFEMSPPIDKLFNQLEKITKNIAIRLPKETEIKQLESFPAHEVEMAYLDGKPKAYTVYFGDLIRKEGITKLEVETT
ncbi:MAG: methyltransferase [Candidatus Moranbacteria bacterium]|nr:methyltransferase [Candidatus Moranbacteria bacterium]